ncbi:MAG: NADH-quinone oxidoreductase subunit L [Chloroflexi bacterium]|nr:NADH-quinone oxidoreductase subunit L [Chloroflexota bacterium]
MSNLVSFLVVFPLLVGVPLAFVTRGKVRNALVVAGGAVIALASLATAIAFGNGSAVFFGLPGDLEPGLAVVAAEAAIALVVIVVSLQHGRRLAPVLATAQLAIAVWLEVTGRMPAADPARLFGFDRLSMVMVLIVGIIGTLICIHALGYMRDYQRTYPQTGGRRQAFFPLLFLFLSSMFGLVTANHLPLLLVFWEVTTLCSFLLIGYTRTGETIGYAFRALNMNLFGGLGFSLAIVLLAAQPDGLDLARLTAGPAGAALLPAIALLALAGLTKSAQLPFSSWLLGAMYAPSPTSALLHSSTMVKAGVFLLLRLSPAMAGSAVGNLVAFTGLLTFLFVSFVATTEQNTKMVLAYSTIGSLGLIVGSAGVGGAELAWVAVMLIIFHAVAKSLLFLVVGTLENRLYTKDMEHFDALLSRMPRLSVLALAGIAGMFIAPFGIVLAKWSAIRAFLEVPGWQGAAFVVILAFGSALTIFYWGKLLIKVLSTQAVDAYHRSVEDRVTGFEWFAELSHAVLVVILAASLGLLSESIVGPYARGLFPGGTGALLHLDPAVVSFMVLAVLFLPALALWSWRKSAYDVNDFYASGRTTNGEHAIAAALGGTRAVTLRNYYLVGVVNGEAVFRAGIVVCGALLTGMIVAGVVLRA